MADLRVFSVPILLGAFVVGLCGGGARAQGDQAFATRIAALRTQIKGAEQQHATDAQLGVLWLRLGNRYQDQMEFPEAEDAFARALRLLRAPEMRVEYVDALEGMGSLYLATARLSEAKDALRKALVLNEALGARAHVAKMHESIALVQLNEKRYREAETESAEGLKELQAVPVPEPLDLEAAYLTHSYALCFQGKCAAALEDANRAMEIAVAKRPAESLDMVVVRLVRGYDLWKTGSPEVGEQEMGEALRLARGLTGLPQPVVVDAQFNVLREYAALLKATHRNGEAKQVEVEMGQIQATRPAGCNRCTVSAAALAPGLMLP